MNRLSGDLPPLPPTLMFCEIEAIGSFTSLSDSNCLNSCANAPKCCGSAVIACGAINDDCHFSLPIRNGTVQVSNLNATTQPCEMCGTCAIGRDVWFSWIAVCTGVATFDLCAVDNATAQVAMAIYDPHWCFPATKATLCAANSDRFTCAPTLLRRRSIDARRCARRRILHSSWFCRCQRKRRDRCATDDFVSRSDNDNNNDLDNDDDDDTDIDNSDDEINNCDVISGHHDHDNDSNRENDCERPDADA
jgi:hypothetical protein